MGAMSSVDAAEYAPPAEDGALKLPGEILELSQGGCLDCDGRGAQASSGWRAWFPCALVGIFLVLWAATQDPTVAGNLDDVYVVLHEARGWLGEWGMVGSAKDVGLGRPLVEGSTSALDVMVKGGALAMAPGADPLALAGWICLAWLCGAVTAFAIAAVRIGGPRWAAWLCTAGFATSLGLVESASYRLEGPLFALLWVSLLGFSIHARSRWAWCLAVLVCLARPEGLFLAPAAWWLSTVGSKASLGHRLGSALAIPGLVTAARLWVYGSWAPNAYFAKRSDSYLSEWLDGASYLDEALRMPSGLGWLVLVCAGLWCSWTLRSAARLPATRFRVPGMWLIGVSLAAAGMLVASGGDSYAGTRLALPLAAPAWFALVCFGPSLRGTVLMAAVIAFLLQLSSARPWLAGDPLSMGRTVWERLRLGPAGEETFAGDSAVFRQVTAALDGEAFAHRHAQRFRWFEPRASVLDLTGITDYDLARTPSAGQVLFGRDAIGDALARRAGAIYLGVRPSRRSAWTTDRPISSREADLRLARFLSDVVESQAFLGPPPLLEELADNVARDYTAASMAHPGSGGFFNLLVRKDLAGPFQRAGFTVTVGL